MGSGSSGAWEVRLQVDGLTNTVTALRNLAPDLSRRMLRELRKAGNTVAKTADASLPPDTKGAYKVRLKTKRGRFTVTVTATTKDAAIFEFAGKKNPAGLCPQGAALINYLNADFGAPGRFLWAAWDAVGGYTQEAMLTAVRAAEAELGKRLASGSGLRGKVL